MARVKAVLRRYKAAPAAAEPTGIKCVEYPDLTINQTNYSVIYMGKSVEMPPKELELLYFLASSPNHVFTREQLLDQIWGYEYIGDTRTVAVSYTHLDVYKRQLHQCGKHGNVVFHVMINPIPLLIKHDHFLIAFLRHLVPDTEILQLILFFHIQNKNNRQNKNKQNQ